MIFATPPIDGPLERRLDELAQLRERLSSETGRPLRWIGTLRRLVRAAAVESSTSIEGFSVDPDDAVALVSGDARPSADDQSQLAVASYGRAMRHVAAMAADPRFRWSERVLLDLHFDACEFQDDKDPGLWRGGPISVTGPGGRIAYRGPDAEAVPDLMAEATDWLERGDLDAPAVVRAAMAHLHVVAIHPFRDGNGRVARIAQSLVLARDGLVSFEFASIEEYLGERTQDYYDMLEHTQGGSYEPQPSGRSSPSSRAWPEAPTAAATPARATCRSPPRAPIYAGSSTEACWSSAALGAAAATSRPSSCAARSAERAALIRRASAHPGS